MSTLCAIHYTLLLTPTCWKSTQIICKAHESHFYKTVDAAEPCHLLKPNWKPSNLTVFLPQLISHYQYPVSAYSLCVCVCVWVSVCMHAHALTHTDQCHTCLSSLWFLFRVCVCVCVCCIIYKVYYILGSLQVLTSTYKLNLPSRAL